MFKLFTDKVSGVFTLAMQGIAKAIGCIVETVTNVVDTVVESVGTLTAPLTEKLTTLPLVGDTVESVLNLESHLLGNLSGGLHAVAEDFSKGDLLGGIHTALGGVTATVGQTLGDVSTIIGNVSGLSTPLTDLLSEVPALAPVVNVFGETSSNLLGLLTETGDYVASINPLDLVTGAVTDPTGSLGGVLKDVSGTLDNLLDDLSPVTGSTASIPVVGDAVGVVGDISGALTQGLYDAGQAISQIDLFEPFQSISFG